MPLAKYEACAHVPMYGASKANNLGQLMSCHFILPSPWYALGDHLPAKRRRKFSLFLYEGRLVTAVAREPGVRPKNPCVIATDNVVGMRLTAE